MIFTRRTLEAPSLDVHHVDAEVRTPHLRVAVRSGLNVTTDYALLGRSIPYAHRMSRPQISVLFEGDGRLDEGHRRAWMKAGELCLSDGGGLRGGSMAYTGDRFLQLLVEWDPAVHGAPWDATLTTMRLGMRDLGRLRHAAQLAIEEPTAAVGIRSLFAILRSIGVPLELADVPGELSPMSALNAAVARWLSALERFPSIDDVAAEVSWNQRRVHRALTALTTQYAVPWTDWRSALHAFRLLNATRSSARRARPRSRSRASPGSAARRRCVTPSRVLRSRRRGRSRARRGPGPCSMPGQTRASCESGEQRRGHCSSFFTRSFRRKTRASPNDAVSV